MRRRVHSGFVSLLAAISVWTPYPGLAITATQLVTQNCPQVSAKFNGYMPKGNTTAGTFVEIGDIETTRKCVLNCCLQLNCNVAFFVGTKCYHVTCHSNELCMPMKNTNPANQVSMVLVRPIGDKSWQEIFKKMDDVEPTKYDLYADQYPDFEFVTPLDYGTSCSIGVDNCPENEECVQNSKKSRAGTCRCRGGFTRTSDGYCIPTPLPHFDAKDSAPKRKLTILVENTEVQMPESEASLLAIVSPGPVEGEKYNFEWTSILKPDGSNAVKSQNGHKMQLTKLSEGLYTFKVNVSSELSYGETFVNVTVLPPSRINKPPQIVITPANQTIKLPNTKAVLDASASTDDDRIVAYHWELQQAPVGYEPHLSDLPTLALSDLDKPGNYTFKLTVTDTDRATSTATANITVLQTTDYPPEADAGPDVIVYLPHNQITLNATMSIDDHNITTWEWTKIDTNLAVDMQDTRTPFLKLSNLEEGVYTFQLKVTDSNNQSSTAKVRVFVKPPTNQPPVAKTEGNITINLPQTWVLVNASQSVDDNRIVKYLWSQVDGPSSATFVASNESVTNVTALTKGSYVFRITVTDDNGNSASALQYVNVDQNKNRSPHANAGNDFKVFLPHSAIYLNGSQSSDDWAIVKWKWTRNDNSLAYGTIGEGSDATAVLILSNLVPGTYIFDLTVYDQQGLSDTDSITVAVQPDPKLLYLVDMIINADIKRFTFAQYQTMVSKMTLLVQDGTKLVVQELTTEMGSQRVVIRFYIENGEGGMLHANGVVRYFREKLKVDADILGFSINGVRTAVCQNNCSGHGYCDEASRECICDTFWMHDRLQTYWRPQDDSNCSWSILYVVLGTVLVLLLAFGSIWGSIYLCVYRCSCAGSNLKGPTTYKLIESTDDNRKIDMSDSDSDSDVVFESRNKNRFVSELRNGHKQRNGSAKISRRMKT